MQGRTLALLLLAPGFVLSSHLAARAQTGLTGAIAGVVRDTTGAVLPGVTVEASSPALIEKVRSVVTDDQGQYKIVELRPGAYAVTFSLSGFSVVRREGLELNTGVTLPVNAEMRVGSLEETITVTGASPVVDTQNIRSQNVLTAQVLDTLPSSKNFQAYEAMTLGATNASTRGAGDVGGTKGETVTALVIHGAGGGYTSVDGMRITATFSGPDVHRYFFNPLAVQEVVLETSGAAPESEAGGLNVNMVPREGSNVLRGIFDADYTGKELQAASNLTDELRQRGITAGNKNRRTYDSGGAVGGPIRADKLWFFVAMRAQSATEEQAGVFFNRTQNTLFYTPDTSRPAYIRNYIRDGGFRLTWQASEKHKFTASVNLQDNCSCYGLGSIIPEAALFFRLYPENLKQATWTYPATSKLLVQAGATFRDDRQTNNAPPETQGARSVRELTTGLVYGSQINGPQHWWSDIGDHGNSSNYNTRFSVSYVTGSHAFKTGVTTFAGRSMGGGDPPYDEQFIFRNQIPVQIRQIAYPHAVAQRSNLKLNLGLYTQDQWTIRQLTLNLGLRFEYLNAYNPAQTRPGGQYIRELSFAPVYNLPNWKDVSPRLGAAYDLFGNGRTAVKVSLGRYVIPEALNIAIRNNPAQLVSADATRTWNDANGNFVPDCTLPNPLANGECGALSNLAFGTTLVTTRYAKDVTEGWHKRPFTWQTAVTMQHELRPGVGLNVGYFRTSWGNFRVTDNRAVDQSEYTKFSLTAPVDPRLPGGGGYQVPGNLYDVNPAKFGRVDNLVIQASSLGKYSSIFNGFEFSVNSRFGRGGLLTAGVSTAQTVTDLCEVTAKRPVIYNSDVGSGGAAPLQFCRATNPWAGQTQIKVTGAYPLPYGLQLSGTLQSLPGFPFQTTTNFFAATIANYAATNAQVAPSLGRNLAACGAVLVGCTATVNVQLMEPYAQREDRRTQVDLRLAKNLRLARMTIQPRVDLYNVFNTVSIINEITTFGPTWLRPTSILGARLVKFGVHFEF